MLRRDSSWMGALLIAALTFICYVGALDNSFHYDDAHSIVENYHIRELAAVPTFFLDSSTFSNEASMAMYRPFLQTTYAINYALGQYEVWGYRLVNLVAHTLTAVTVFALMLRLGAAPAAAWLAGAVFAVHPINSQTVNYISSRSELLYVLGVLGASYAHLYKRDRRLAGLAYSLALLCKSAAVVFVPLLILAEVARGTPAARALRRASPYVLLSAGYLVIVTMDGFLPRSLGQEVRPFDVQVYTQTKALVFYLQLIAMPVALSVEHAFAEAVSIADATVLASGALMASVLGLAFRHARALPWVTFGTLWFFCGLSLTFLVPLNVLVNEHRLYLPSIGLLIVLCGAMRPCAQRRSHRGYLRAGPRWLAVALLVICGVHTAARNTVWADELSLWRDAAARAPGMFRVQSNLGLALYERGEMVGARAAFERSIELNPAYSKSWSNLGLVYDELGLLARAEESYERARQLSPELSGGYNNLGRLYARQGRADDAEPLLRTALRLEPRNVQAWVNLGRLLQGQGRPSAAEEAYRTAIGLDPGYAPAFNNLGLLLGELGEGGEARRMLLQAVELDPSYIDAAVNLRLHDHREQGLSPAAAYRRVLDEFPDQIRMWKALAESELRSGRWKEAAAAYEEIRSRAADVETLGNLALAYRNAGRIEAAIAAYEAALELDPGSVWTLNNLASARAASGDLEGALRATRAALALDPADERATANHEQLRRAEAAGNSGTAVPK